MSLPSLEGRVALVTGASSGIGMAMARLLAARGATLVLCARRKERLEALAEELGRDDRPVTVLPADLSEPAAVEALLAELARREIEVDVLINNAGAGLHRDLVDSTWAAVASQIQLNIVALTQLTHALSRAMKARGRGHILNVASVGAYLPVPSYATYAAAKAFVRNFSEAVAAELAPHGVTVTCLCPGGTATGFFDAAEQEVPWHVRISLMSAERCARIGLAALFAGRRNVVSGVANTLGMILLRLVPRRALTLLATLAMGRARPSPADGPST